MAREELVMADEIKSEAVAEEAEGKQSSLWTTIGKIGSGTVTVALIGAAGSWLWNTIDRHEKEITAMKQEIIYLQKQADKVDRHETDIGVMKVVVGMRESVK
jgi:hypothetical protein